MRTVQTKQPAIKCVIFCGMCVVCKRPTPTRPQTPDARQRKLSPANATQHPTPTSHMVSLGTPGTSQKEEPNSSCEQPATQPSTYSNMANKDPSQYVQDLKEQDVVLGRGSGPNDRTGNIEFRNLILTRKAEYLAAKTREIKGRIAAEVVNSVRARGGRFLRKLTPSQAKDAGFNKGEEVYELADEPTVMEKAKQTLRQNRANFEKNIQQATETNNNVASQENDINSIPMPDANTIMGAASLMSMNPISNSQASRMLDSDKLPQLRSRCPTFA